MFCATSGQFIFFIWWIWKEFRIPDSLWFSHLHKKAAYYNVLAAGNWHFAINKEIKYLLLSTGLILYCLGVLPEGLSEEDCELYARWGRVLKYGFLLVSPCAGAVSGVDCVRMHTQRSHWAVVTGARHSRPPAVPVKTDALRARGSYTQHTLHNAHYILQTA